MFYVSKSPINSLNSNFAVLIGTVNSEFQEITEYFKMHKQAQHPDKTKFIVFSHNCDVLANPSNFVINSMTKIKISPTSCFNTLPIPAIRFLSAYPPTSF